MGDDQRLIQRDPRRQGTGVRAILLTSEECGDPCDELKEAFKNHISMNDIEVRSVTDPADDFATELGTLVVDNEGTIPSLVILDSDDYPILVLTPQELGMKLEGT